MKKSVGLFLLGLFALSLASCGVSAGTYPDSDKYLAGNQTYCENITSLDVNWLSGSLTLVEDENISGVKVEEVTTATKNEELVHTYLNEGILKVKYFASGYTRPGFGPFKKDLTITYHPALSSIIIDMTSGTFNAKTLTADDIKIDMTSGSANIGTIVAKDIKNHFTSGGLTIEHIKATNYDADFTSGTAKVGFDELSNGKFALTSGAISINLPEDGGQVSVHKTSGSITTHRECSISDGTYTFGEGKARINVSMTSGDLLIS